MHCVRAAAALVVVAHMQQYGGDGDFDGAGARRPASGASGARDSSVRRRTGAPSGGGGGGGGSGVGGTDTAGISVSLDRTGAASLVDGDVDYAGWLEKRGYMMHNLCTCLPPRHKPRYVVVKGGFLFKFADEGGASGPKGRPVALAGATIEAGGDDGSGPSADEDRCFMVSTVRKVMVLRAPNGDARDEWVAALNAAKRAAIKRKLGHAHESADAADARRLGESLIAQKETRAATKTSDGFAMLREVSGTMGGGVM